MRRPRCITAAAALLVCAALTRTADERAPAAPAANPFQKDEVDKALDRAIAYLVSRQGGDGSIGENSRGRKPGQDVDPNSTAMTSLAIMAIASLGHEPGDQTPEGKALKKALDCVLEPRRQLPDGYLGGRDGSRMYGHGIATLMLGEILGMGVDEEQDKKIRARLAPALELIMRSQKIPRNDQRHAGGWRYEPTSPDADLSASVWQVMALRSAKNAGLAIPKDVIDKAAEYIRGSYEGYSREKAGQNLRPAGYAYQPGGSGTYAAAAAGLLALQVCGFYEDSTVKGAADWLLVNKPRWEERWFLYGTYYYAQGMFQRGDKHADEARKNVQTLLLARQETKGEHAGSWLAGNGDESGHGRVYATSLAVLSLSVKYHYLPIYQR
jgi:hypothetical protein